MQISWNEVADRVWGTVTQPEDANVVCIAGDERAMLVDTGGTSEVGAAVLASARELAGVPLEHVVITHHHFDHWHGLAGMEGVESIAHENIVGDDTPEALRPTRTFSLAFPLNLGNRFVEIVHFGPAHTRSDIVVVAQDPGVIVTGDLLESS
ncbi:MAG: MBL fold metallo-hydrolase, partial [Propionibacterium sp.]|nr:MBL fold metallo-hydrolase [Propionibacterium sp.]